ncbi:hypothetical protein GCM10027563_30200 [Parasphingorhabdus pacifica]
MRARPMTNLAPEATTTSTVRCQVCDSTDLRPHQVSNGPDRLPTPRFICETCGTHRIPHI